MIVVDYTKKDTDITQYKMDIVAMAHSLLGGYDPNRKPFDDYEKKLFEMAEKIHEFVKMDDKTLEILANSNGILNGYDPYSGPFDDYEKRLFDLAKKIQEYVNSGVTVN